MPQDKAPQAARKGRTVVRPSDAAKKSADTLLEEITPEEQYSDDGYAVIPMWYPTTLLPNGSRVFLFLKNYDRLDFRI